MSEETTALYINSNGKPVTHASYSARQTFKHCPREFKLSRVDGWWSKGERAAPLFGKAIEAGVQRYHESKLRPDSGVEEFLRIWQEVVDLPKFKELIFTDKEKDWGTLRQNGIELLKLYEVKLPYLPISVHPPTIFQQVIRKQLFPGTKYAILENKAILDMMTFPRWDHPWLKEIEKPEHGETRTLIIDIKTSGENLRTDLVALDPQLAEYAWQTRVLDVGFLWFMKANRSIKSGDRVSLLVGNDVWKPGFELHVLDTDTDPSERELLYVGVEKCAGYFADSVKGLRGKAREAMKSTILANLITKGEAAKVDVSDVTKQRVQFGAARLEQSELDEVGQQVGQTTIEMLHAHEHQTYPKLPGIRFPNQKCQFCSLRHICLNNPEARDRELTKKGEEWLDGDTDAE
jgi:hypothetical protein